MLKNLTILACILAFLSACGGKDTTKNEASQADKKEATDDAKASGTGKKANKASQEESRQKALESINGYYQGLASGDYDAAASNFSAKVAQWITLKNTTPKAVATEAKRFLSKKKDVNYTVNEKSLNLHGNVASIQVRQQWTGYDTTVEVEILLDKDAKIMSYIERKVLKKLKSAPTNSLANYLKNLPEKKLPFKYEGDNGKEISDLGMKILVAPEDIALFKTGMQQGIMSMYECFWYAVSDEIVAIVTLSGGRIQEYTLTTFNRKTGKKIGEQNIGSAGHLAMTMTSTTFEFGADFKITSVVTSNEPSFDAEGNQQGEPKNTENVYEYGVTSKGEIIVI